MSRRSTAMPCRIGFLVENCDHSHRTHATKKPPRNLAKWVVDVMPWRRDTHAAFHISGMDGNPQEMDQLVGPRRTGVPGGADCLWRDARSVAYRLSARPAGPV